MGVTNYYLTAPYLTFAVPTAPRGAEGRVRGQSVCCKCSDGLRDCHTVRQLAGYSHHSVSSPTQRGESTPNISGYFEVEVNGELIHSKKVHFSTLVTVHTPFGAAYNYMEYPAVCTDALSSFTGMTLLLNLL